MMEEWRAIPGFKGFYEVSDQGRVRSLDRIVMCEGSVRKRYASRKKGRILRPGRMTLGHMSVVLGREAGSRCVHELVLLAFEGPKPPKMEARHLNGIESDNIRSNLKWDTRGNNTRDKKWHKGAKTYKLHPDQIKDIKRELANPYYGIGVALAAKYSVSDCTISCIKRRKIHIDV
jgi:hypothetical protein